jgi:predicted secreted protein
VPTLPAGVELLGSEYETPAAGMPPGSPVVQVFRFRAANPGAHDIAFVLKRAWEPTPIETHTVSVTTP